MRFALLCQVILVTALPIVVAMLPRRRVTPSLSLWWAGAATIVASQIVHLPLNWLLETVAVLENGRLASNTAVMMG